MCAGGRGRDFFLLSGLPPPTLSQIWRLSDRDGDGKLNPAEFSVAMCLLRGVLEGAELPSELAPPLCEALGQFLEGQLPAMEERHVVKCKTAFTAFKTCIVTGKLACEFVMEIDRVRVRECVSFSVEATKYLFSKTNLSQGQLFQIWSVVKSSVCVNFSAPHQASV